MRIRIHLRSPLQTLLITLTALCAAALAGCGGGVTTSTGGSLGAPTPGPLTLQSIDNCVTDANNDVIVGSQSDGAKAGCDTVNAAPGSATAQFGEIIVKNGGLLTVPAGATKLNPLTVTDICLDNGGKFIVGSAGQPITAKFRLTFTGNSSAAGSSDPACGGTGPQQNLPFRKGIDVTAGATLELYGAEGIPQNGGISWTTLAAPAGASVSGAKAASTGSQTLDLTADVTQGAGGWKKGDWIVVATTTFNPFETEFVQIASVTPGGANGAGSTVTLKQPLKYYHFGSPAPSAGTSATCLDRLGNPGAASYCDGASKNYGVDERAEVGLISRDIEMTANTATITTPANITAGSPVTADSAATLDEHWGGEIMIHAGFAKVAIQGVRLSKFGKDQLGSYPIHFHRVGDITQAPNPGTANVLINADSVDHSYNKCVTIHDTSNLTVSNLVCARIVGHIFYEELNSATGPNSNNVADDSNITFKNNLGLGAMSNSFDINGPVTISSAGTSASGFPLHDETLDRQQLIGRYWWTGDNMTNDTASPDYISYDGFNITDTDNQGQATHGACFTFGSGVLQLATTATPCGKGEIYAEPATGFWIQNPGTNLTGNAIGGCQGVGNGFWWVPPQNPITVNGSSVALLYQPMGTVKDDRAHACYNGFFGDNSIGFVTSSPLFPHAGGVAGAAPVIATMDGVTATRNRFRGLWMRPTWFVVTNGRFATNRDNVTLLTSGGIDGNAPGVWELLENSVVVGLSRNNVERWGPCPVQSDVNATVGGTYGCIDYTPADTSNSHVPHSGDIYDQGYQPPSWNSAGYMLYDGPVRVFHDRFVNFNYNQGWTSSTKCSDTGAAFYQELDTADCRFLQKMYELKAGQKNASNLGGPPVPYEGDAALGWFQSNANSYPTGTASRQLSFVNTNLRHQVYTKQVSLNTDFNDGDKNTAILDEDGTLSGLGVELAPNSGTNPVFPISLNNLPFNSTSNSVDECISRGAQNNLYEGRTSALMSPASMGTLQFSSLYPYSGSSFPGTLPTGHWQQVSFTRDDLALAQYPASSSTYTGPFPAANMYPVVMRTGRQGLGSYEPKVSNGYGYTVAVAPTTAVGSVNAGQAGLAHWVDITLADTVDPNISSAHPFYVRLGIDYNTKGHAPPPDASYFAIKRGYKSYVGGNVWQGDPALLKYWKALNCTNLDSQNLPNLPTADGGKGDCPGGTVSTLTAVSSIGALTNTDGTPKIDAYYYDKATGYLYLNIVQDAPNPVAPSPTGSCANGNSNAACPDTVNGETYYACPKNGCMDYTIAVKSDSTYTYTPGPSSTGAPAKTDLKPAPASQNQLVLYGTSTVITRTQSLDKQNVPYHTATNGPTCKATQP